jgi:hypothetical protein
VKPVPARSFPLTIVLTAVFASPTYPDDPLSPNKRDRATVKDVSKAAEDQVTYFMNKSPFFIPLHIEEKVREKLLEVVLYVSEDRGRTYRKVASRGPWTGTFRFEAPHDGDYWFAVRTVDREGKRIPRRVKAEAPALKTRVDTRNPVVRLKAVRREEKVVIDWSAQDLNLNVQTLRLEYRTAGTLGWARLPVRQWAVGQHTWTPPKDTALEVRLQVRDRAGNTGEATAFVPATRR